jgi:hypothetical protein
MVTCILGSVAAPEPLVEYGRVLVPEYKPVGVGR